MERLLWVPFVAVAQLRDMRGSWVCSSPTLTATASFKCGKAEGDGGGGGGTRAGGDGGDGEAGDGSQTRDAAATSGHACGCAWGVLATPLAPLTASE